GGVSDMMTAISGEAEIMVRQDGIADTSLSALDERIGDKIAVLPGVAHVSGLGFTGTILPESGSIFLLFGYAPNEYGIQQFNVVEGEHLTNNHQILLGRMISTALHKSVGDTVEVGGSRFRVVGIYESGTPWEEMGGVISLRDAQSYMGRPRKVTMYMVKVDDPSQAPRIVERINAELPDAHASLSGEFSEQMPDMQAADGMMAGISFLALAVGGVGVLNTMLMSVLERTREIGVLRALGWRRRRVLGMIINESLLLGLIGGLVGIVVAFGLTFLINLIPMFGSILSAQWDFAIFARALTVAILLGLLGGLYPAYRATRLQPVEALRYE
ncbi:MAG: FtsX-like permease family protein, partial [Anaerolineales bacterium]